jgi:hypothetical protein
MIEACRSAKSALVIFIGVGSWVLPDCNARRVASQEKQPTDELACVGRLSLIDTREGAGSSVCGRGELQATATAHRPGGDWPRELQS